MKELIIKGSYIDALDAVVAAEVKASVSGGLLNNDYSGIWYITNNGIRAAQVKEAILAEMSVRKIKASLVPLVMPYKLAFLYLAAMAKHGFVDMENITEYSEEWLEFLMYDISKKTIKDSDFLDSYGETDNRRANLSRDFKNFISSVVLYEGREKLEKVSAVGKGSFVEKTFYDAYKNYDIEEKKYPGTKFFHTLTAYEQLYKITKDKTAKHVDKVILIENEELLEPMFKEIIKNISTNGIINVERAPLSALKLEEKTELFHFMTPLDEAEYIGWKVKELLSSGVRGGEIAVVVCGAETNDMIEMVFDRFKIAREQTGTYKSEEIFRLFKTIFGLIYKKEDNYQRISEIFEIKDSMFNLTRIMHFALRRKFSEEGLKAQINPAETLINVVDEILANPALVEYGVERENEKKEDLDKLKKFSVLLSHAGKITLEDMLSDCVKPKGQKNSGFIMALMASVLEMDGLLDGLKGDDYLNSAEALFEIVSKREYTGRREKMFLTGNKDTDYKSYFVPVVPAVDAAAIEAKYLFLCGLNSSFDKRERIACPLSIALETGIQTPEVKRTKTLLGIEKALSNCTEARVSYAYLNMHGKEAGQASVIKALIERLPKSRNIVNKGWGMLRSDDLIEPEVIKTDKAPDNSFAYLTSKAQGVIDFAVFENTVFKNYTVESVLDMCAKEHDGKKTIDVTSFSEFIMCPRKFVFNMLAKKTGIISNEADSIAKMTKGTFWHKVFELAALDKDFSVADEKKIQKSLIKALNMALTPAGWNDEEKKSKRNPWDAGIFTSGGEIVLKAEAEQMIIPAFAKNEVVRKNIDGKKMVITLMEEKIMIPISGTKYMLRGKPDRVDIAEDNSLMVVWDYKTGKVKKDKMRYIVNSRDKKTRFHTSLGDKSIQLMLYSYILKKSGFNIQNCYGGNIWLNGEDNHNFDCNFEKEEMELVEKAFETFSIFLSESFSKMDKTDFSINKDIYDAPCKFDGYGKCAYCNYAYACKLMI